MTERKPSRRSPMPVTRDTAQKPANEYFMGAPSTERKFNPPPTRSELQEAEINLASLLALPPIPDLSFTNIHDTAGVYLKGIGAVPLLTWPEEVVLAQKMAKGASAAKRIISCHDPGKTKKFEADIAAGQVARDHLVRANMRLVVSIAKKYLNRGVDFLDLVQEGNDGLIIAADKFAWRRGNRFVTLAVWWIRQAVTRAIANQRRDIRLPIHMATRVRKMLQIKERWLQETGKEPTVAELAAEMGLPLKEVKRLFFDAQDLVELNVTQSDGPNRGELGESLKDNSSPDPAEAGENALLKEQIKQLLSELPPREAQVLKLRFGLEDGQGRSLDEVGKILKVTRERIRQIEVKALARLRKPVNEIQLR